MSPVMTVLWFLGRACKRTSSGLSFVQFSMSRCSFENNCYAVIAFLVLFSTLFHIYFYPLLVSASSGLFESFKNNLKQHQAAHQVMELLSGYESACTEQVTCLKKLSKSVTRNQPK